MVLLSQSPQGRQRNKPSTFTDRLRLEQLVDISLWLTAEQKLALKELREKVATKGFYDSLDELFPYLSRLTLLRMSRASVHGTCVLGTVLHACAHCYVLSAVKWNRRHCFNTNEHKHYSV